MTNYDAGITMDAFSTLPIYKICMVKVASIMVSHPIDIIRVNMEANAHRLHRLTIRHMLERMSRHGLQGFYHGVFADITRCNVQSLCTYHLFKHFPELLLENKYFLMLKPYNTDFIKAMSSLLSGIVSTPFAKLAVMRQADLTRSPFYRRNYGAFTSSLKCMFRKGGVHNLFIGWRMNGINNALMTGLEKPVSNYVEGRVLRVYNNDSWVPYLTRMALTGSILNLLMTPIDTLTVIALNHSRYSDFTYEHMIRLVIKKHGYKGFFFGLKPSLISLIPNILLISVATRLLLNEKPPEIPPDGEATSSQPTGR